MSYLSGLWDNLFFAGLQDPGPFLECPLGINQEKFLFQENIFQI